MWTSDNNIVQDYLETSSTISSNALVVAEWNLNIADNVNEIGNYRNRPDAALGDYDEAFMDVPTTFMSETALTATKYYYGATDSDITVDGGVTDDGSPQVFVSSQDKMKSLYSLEDCLNRFRPRSGINKAMFFNGKYLNRVNPEMARQPRFYFPTPRDKFKYWTSFRYEPITETVTAPVTKIGVPKLVGDKYVTKIYAKDNDFMVGDYVVITGVDEAGASLSGGYEIIAASSSSFKIYSSDANTKVPAGNIVVDPEGTATVTRTNSQPRGISYRVSNEYLIDDAAPFVTYKTAQPANRLVVKMQTKVGDIDLGPYTDENGSTYADPFFHTTDNPAKAVPETWRIDLLDSNNNWYTAVSFDAESRRSDGSEIIGSDGYVELSYGLKNIPSQYKNIIVFAGDIASVASLPVVSPEGYAWLQKDASGPGTYYISNGGTDDNKMNNYDVLIPSYGWYFNESEIPVNSSSFVRSLTNPESYMASGVKHYREMEYVKGMRIVVDSMTLGESTFDLIEMSPRLSADITDMVSSLSVSKFASDLGSSGLPVGQLLASTGSLDMLDYDQAFNPNNTNSLVKYLSTTNLQVKIYESLSPGDGYIYSIPIKTLYAEGFPSTSNADRKVSINLRDLFFYLESMQAPEILIPNCSLSMAVSCLLDSIGFSNYTFKRANSTEYIIPYFFVGPDTTVAQAIEDLAISTQTAVFFDEYNNLVFMDKEYMMPQDEDTRSTDITLVGDNTVPDRLANIVQLASVKDDVFNDGKIAYETKYIQRSYASLTQAGQLDSDKTWVYKPVLLWEVSPEENTKAWNDESGKQSSYTLAAIPLDSDLKGKLVEKDSALWNSLGLVEPDANSTVKMQTTDTGALALKYNLPYVENGVVKNNTMDLGEAVYWLSRYNGYFYANGEIIKFDAVQYNVPIKETTDIDGTIVLKNTGGIINPTGEIKLTKPELIKKFRVGQVITNAEGTFADNTLISKFTDKGSIYVDPENILITSTPAVNFRVRERTNNVWINSPEEYQKYFADIPFGGKMYPTGLVRIYSEPYYDSVNNTLKEGKVAKHGRGQFKTKVVDHLAGLNDKWTSDDNIKKCFMKSTLMFNGGTIPTTYQNVKAGVIASASGATIKNMTTNGIIKNYLSSRDVKEKDANKLNNTNPGTMQSSALIMDGPSYPSDFNPQDFIQYIPKQLDDRFVHYATRMRIIGSLEDEKSKAQTPVGSMPYYTVDGKNIGGSSGGISIWVDPATNCGYYYEIVALTDTEANAYTATGDAINTVFFYKIQADANGTAIPIVLWSGLAPIAVDDGRFTGQNRMANEKTPTVYDLAVEYKQTGKSVTFYLYLNDQIIGYATDSDMLKQTNNVALFIRGSSRVMFENISAVTSNYSSNNSSLVSAPVASVFGMDNANVSSSMNKYGLSGAIRSTYLSGVSAKNDSSEYNIYFEEFGTIMRECAYFNIKYDKAYPALFAKISPTFNDNQGYTISGFTANAYGAEFLLFNATDTVLSLDSTSGNYLRIQGVTFTQNSRHDLTVDEYFTKQGELSDPQYRDNQVYNADKKQIYSDVKKNRLTYGKKSFSINGTYLQSQDAAEDMMQWLVNKVMQPRKAVGLEIFSMPTLQLGDIVKIQYSKDGIQQVAEATDERFVVYSIEYNRSPEGPQMVVHLSEVK